MRPTTYYRPDGRVEVLVVLDEAPRVFVVDPADVARVGDLKVLADWHRERRRRSRAASHYGTYAEPLEPLPSFALAAARRGARRRLLGA